MMAIQNSENISDFVPGEDLEKETSPSAVHLTLNDLAMLPINVSAELGRCSIKIKDILKLDKGSIVTLNKQAGELADIFFNGILIGRGEMIVLADTLHIRIVEIEGFKRDEE